MNIYLIGFMGTGKSTVSKQLAAKLGWKLLDTDAYIEEKQNRKIRDIFATEGETAFRDMETKALQEIAEMDNEVVSCGGGIVLRRENAEIMRQSGRIILLNASPETVFERVRFGNDRPLLNGNMNVEYISQLMNKRMPLYEYAADSVIDTDGRSILEIAEKIIDLCDK